MAGMEWVGCLLSVDTDERCLSSGVVAYRFLIFTILLVAAVLFVQVTSRRSI